MDRVSFTRINNKIAFYRPFSIDSFPKLGQGISTSILCEDPLHKGISASQKAFAAKRCWAFTSYTVSCQILSCLLLVTLEVVPPKTIQNHFLEPGKTLPKVGGNVGIWFCLVLRFSTTFCFGTFGHMCCAFLPGSALPPPAH